MNKRRVAAASAGLILLASAGAEVVRIGRPLLAEPSPDRRRFESRRS